MGKKINKFKIKINDLKIKLSEEKYNLRWARTEIADLKAQIEALTKPAIMHTPSSGIQEDGQSKPAISN